MRPCAHPASQTRRLTPAPGPLQIAAGRNLWLSKVVQNVVGGQAQDVVAKAEVYVGAAFGVGAQPLEPVRPGEAAFEDPAGSAQAGAVRDAAARTFHHREGRRPGADSQEAVAALWFVPDFHSRSEVRHSRKAQI